MRYGAFILVMTMAFGSSGCNSTQGNSLAPAVQTDARTIELFNGRDLTGWTFVLDKPDAKVDEVWSIKDRVLRCEGVPAGYLKTLAEYDNYAFDIEWRWPEGSKPGNNGVLVHTSTPGALGIWPKSIEVQLANGAAGDFWIIGTELKVTDVDKRRKGRRHLRLVDNVEKPLGQWNHMEITCRGNEILVKVNGTLVNHATDCSVTRGTISLQSEGAPIEYRNIRLRPLK